MSYTKALNLSKKSSKKTKRVEPDHRNIFKDQVREDAQEFYESGTSKNQCKLQGYTSSEQQERQTTKLRVPAGWMKRYIPLRVLIQRVCHEALLNHNLSKN